MSEATDKMARGYLFWFVLFWITGGAFAWHEYKEHRNLKPDCAEMTSYLWGVEKCLKFRPTCEGLSHADLGEYHKIRDTYDEVCAADRGDTFLSQ